MHWLKWELPNRGFYMKKAILLISILSLLLVSCQSEPSIQYTYRQPENINDGFDVGTLDEVNIDAKLIEKAVNEINRGKYKEVHSMLIFKDDNLFIERLWRSVKYEEVYLKAYQDGKEARTGIGNYFRFYNTERPHQALGYLTPAEVFSTTPVETNSAGMVESLTSDPLRIAGTALTIAPILS